MTKFFYDEVYLHNKDCEGINCNSIATYKLKIKAENVGSITLLLCDKCKLQFIKENENVK